MTTTPASITDKIVELCNEVNGNTPVYIECDPLGWCRRNECYDNVDRMIEKNGGKRVLGWAIWQWNNVLVEAEAHAVWENQEGKLLDISPHGGEKKILFLQDDSIIFDGKPIKSRRKALTDSQLVAELIALHNMKDDIVCKDASKTASLPVPLIEGISKLTIIINAPTDRNSPCSCGSGIKYKKCCGRFK